MATNESAVFLENLSKALKCTQELRASVSAVFEKLSNGLKVAETTGDKDKSYLSDLRECLETVNSDVEQLEKVANATQNGQVPFSLGHLGTMTVDPFLDKTPYHQQITQTYKRAAKAQTHAVTAYSLLHGSLPKRSLMGGSGSAAGKRFRRPMTVACTVTPQNVDMVIQSYCRFVDITVVTTHPFGSPAVLQITVGKTMKALVVLRGLAIDWVIVKAFQEDFNVENGKGVDLWSSSKHSVFQKVTQHARSMSLQYGYQGNVIEFGLRQFLMWLNSYKTLFSSPCHKCGKILQNYMPPTWHDVRSLGVFEAYHEHCRP